MTSTAILDGGWGWAVVFAGALNNFLCMGLIRSGGLIYISSVEVFHATRTLAAWIPMVTVTVLFMAAPFGTAIAKRYSFHFVVAFGGTLAVTGLLICSFATHIGWLFFGWGCIFGLGAGLVLFPSIASVGIYFKKKRPLGTGLVLAGGAIGSFCLPPFLEYLIECYTLKGATLIMSGMIMHYWVSASLLKLVSSQVCRTAKAEERYQNNKNHPLLLIKSDNIQNGKEKMADDATEPLNQATNGNGMVESNGGKQENGGQLFKIFTKTNVLLFLRNRTFVINCMANSVQTSVFLGMVTLLPDFGEDDIGVTRIEGAYIVSVTAISDLSMRLFFGWVMSKKALRKELATMIVLLVNFLALLALAFVRTYTLVVVCAVIVGACFACGMVLYFEVLAACMPPEIYLMAVGFSEMVKAPFLAAVASTLGSLKDATGSYSVTFLIFTNLMFIALMLWVVETCLLRRTKHQQSSPSL